MFCTFLFLLTAICAKEELKLLKNKNKTVIANHKVACDALKSKMKNISSDFCKDTATEDEKTVVYNYLQNVFENSVKELSNRITQLTKFKSNFPKDVSDKNSENIFVIVGFLKKKLENDCLKVTVNYDVKISFIKVYCDKLKDLAYVHKNDSLKAALNNKTLDDANEMFQTVWDTYLNVIQTFKAYYEKKIMKLKQKGEEKTQLEKKKLDDSKKEKTIDKKEKTSDSKGKNNDKILIIVFIAVVGGLVVIAIIICLFYHKINASQRNTEYSYAQSEVEEL